jgi:hypothetical protein
MFKVLTEKEAEKRRFLDLMRIEIDRLMFKVLTEKEAEKRRSLDLVKIDGWKINSLSEELKADMEIIMMATYTYYPSFKYALEDARIEVNKDLILKGVGIHANVLSIVPEIYQDDRDVVKIAMKGNGFMLEYASKRLRNDKEVALIAMRITGFALHYASNMLRDDEDVVRAAMRSNSKLDYYDIPAHASKRMKDLLRGGPEPHIRYVCLRNDH